MSSYDTPRAELRKKVWRGIALLVAISAAFGLGHVSGYRRADVNALRETIKEQQSRIRDLEIQNSWEFKTSKQAHDLRLCRVDLDACEKRLAELVQPKASQDGDALGATKDQ